MGYSNSSLVTYKKLTGDYSTRKNKIDTITIHCFVGQVTAKQGCDYFYSSDRQVSSNYVVGCDGSIGLSVEEKNRAWTSGGALSVNGITGAMNDHRAITIEVACDTQPPYRVTDAAYKALIELVADICKRNNIKKLIWKNDKTLVGKPDKQNMTIHRWFSNTDCPGQYLIEHMADIAEQANKKLGAETTATKPTTTASSDAPQNIGGNDMTRGYFKKGDKNEGVYAYKQLLIALKKAGIITQNIDNNNAFGEGTVTATKQLQKAARIEQDGFAGPMTIRAAYTLLAGRIK